MTRPITSPQLILASRSCARASILRKANIKFTVEASDVDEEALIKKKNLTDVLQIVTYLARAKAEAIALPLRYAREPFFVLGCDSAFEFEGATYGKPYTAEVAARRIRQFEGKSGVLHTAHWLIAAATGSGKGATSSATVTFDNISTAEIAAYIATGEPLYVAGSFTLDGIGASFVKSIEGNPAAVIGLDINILRKLLKYFKIDITTLWR